MLIMIAYRFVVLTRDNMCMIRLFDGSWLIYAWHLPLRLKKFTTSAVGQYEMETKRLRREVRLGLVRVRYQMSPPSIVLSLYYWGPLCRLSTPSRLSRPPKPRLRPNQRLATPTWILLNLMKRT